MGAEGLDADQKDMNQAQRAGEAISSRGVDYPALWKIVGGPHEVPAGKNGAKSWEWELEARDGRRKHVEVLVFDEALHPRTPGRNVAERARQTEGRGPLESWLGAEFDELPRRILFTGAGCLEL